MKHSWNTIEEQIDTSHNQIQKLINKNPIIDFVKDHFIALSFAGIGLLLLAFSFNNNASFQASLIPTEDDLVLEAESFDINPISTNEEASDTETEENTEEKAQVAINPFVNSPDIETQALANNSETSTVNDDEMNNMNEETESVQSINPFLSLESSSNVAEEFHAAAEDNSDNQIEEIIPSQTFKVNTHTYDKVPQDQYAYTDTSLINDAYSSESPEIVKVLPSDLGQRIKGVLRAGKATTHPFGFYLETVDKKMLKINTNRDLRNVIGKEISIQIKGDLNNFELMNVYYSPSSKNLAKSGPASSLSLSILLSVTAFAFFRYKKSLSV